MNEKNNPTKNSKKSATPETLKIPEKICDSRCRICISDYLKEIHSLKKAGKTFRQIAAIAKFDISASSLSRHFQNYLKQKTILSARIIKDDLVEEATKQAVHTQKIIGLIDITFVAIKARVDSGKISLGIDELDKLMKLRYQVLQGQDTNENDILAIFQKASNKYGLDLQQGVLFKQK